MAFSTENSLLLAPMKSVAAISRAIKNGVPCRLKWNAHQAEVMKTCGMKCFYVTLIIMVIKFIAADTGASP